MSDSNTTIDTTVETPFSARRDEAIVRKLEIEAEVAERSVAEMLGTPQMTGAITIIGELNSEVAAQVVAMLDYMRENSDDGNPLPVHITLSHLPSQRHAPGTLMDTFAVYDAVRLAGKRGHKVTMQVIGNIDLHMAILLQAADRRIIAPSGFIFLAEEEWGQMRITSHSVDDEISFRGQLEQQGRRLLLAQSDITPEELAENLEGAKNPWWLLSAEDAKTRGLVDDVDLELAVPPLPFAADLQPEPGDSIDVRKDKAICRKAEAEAALSRFQAKNMAGAALEGRQLLFFTDVNPMSALVTLEHLKEKARKPGSEVSLVINSPGGSIVHGGFIIDAVKKMKAAGHTFKTTALGMAASMGGVLLQLGDDGERAMGENAWLLVHRASGSLNGSTRNMTAQKQMLDELEEQVVSLLAERSHLSEKEIRDRTQGRDWWMPATDALKHGFIDKIL